MRKNRIIYIDFIKIVSFHKVSIIPRGQGALGYTMQMPEEDRYLKTKQELMDKMTVLMGGRVAEELVFNEITTGAQNDLEVATQFARRMVCEFGMSDLGNRTFGQKDQNVFLGRELTQHSRDYGGHLADKIDKNIDIFIESAYKRATGILTKNKNYDIT